MDRRITRALAALVIAALPAILVGNALWAMLNVWFVEAQYSLPGFPADAGELPEERRLELARTGLEAIRPGTEGVELLRQARLPGGAPAFDAREISHMDDVRGVVRVFLMAWGIALATAIAAGAGLWRTGATETLRRAAAGGALMVLAAMALAGVAMLLSFGAFFTAFHGVFFEGDTWRFASDATLLRIYPEFFWQVAGAALAALVVLQAVGLLLLTRGVGARAPADREDAGDPT